LYGVSFLVVPDVAVSMSRQSDADIEGYLADNGPATAPEIATALGVHPMRVERRCGALQRCERIRLVTGGRYAVVTDRPVHTRQASD
jgi:predicted ArsR family transcriptional regulator